MSRTGKRSGWFLSKPKPVDDAHVRRKIGAIQSGMQCADAPMHRRFYLSAQLLARGTYTYEKTAAAPRAHMTRAILYQRYKSHVLADLPTFASVFSLPDR